MLAATLAILNCALTSQAPFDIREYFQRAYPKKEPIEFITSIHVETGYSNYLGLRSIVMQTVFLNKTNFRIERRDVWTSAGGKCGTASGVLWARDGKVRIWFSRGDTGIGSTREVDPVEYKELRGLASFEGRWRDFANTRQHKLLFEEFDWLAGNWNTKGSVSERIGTTYPGVTEKISRNSPDMTFISEESSTVPGVKRAPIDGYRISTNHFLYWSGKPNADFSPPD